MLILFERVNQRLQVYFRQIQVSCVRPVVVLVVGGGFVVTVVVVWGLVVVGIVVVAVRNR